MPATKYSDWCRCANGNRSQRQFRWIPTLWSIPKLRQRERGSRAGDFGAESGRPHTRDPARPPGTASQGQSSDRGFILAGPLGSLSKRLQSSGAVGLGRARCSGETAATSCRVACCPAAEALQAVTVRRPLAQRMYMPALRMAADPPAWSLSLGTVFRASANAASTFKNSFLARQIKPRSSSASAILCISGKLCAPSW